MTADPMPRQNSRIPSVPRVLLEDQTLRDGLQMESRIFSLEEKLTLFDRIKKAGFRRIQAGSFVQPGIVPQMADTGALIRTIQKQPKKPDDPVISALILNEKGLERALECRVTHVTLSASVSDTHSRKNTRRAAADAIDAMAVLIREALSAGLTVSGGLQCVFGCVYEGPVQTAAVLSALDKMAAAGAERINLADTTGMADPYSIRKMVQTCGELFPGLKISLHLHNTRGLGLANMYSGYEAGVRAFDVCAGGLGGCPFVRNAAGNVAAEDAVNMFSAMGVETGIDLQSVCQTVVLLEHLLEKKLPGHMNQALTGCARAAL